MMPALLATPLGRYIAGALGVLAIVAALIGAVRWYGHSQYEAGRQVERDAAVKLAAKRIEQRAADDKALERLDAPALCVELDGTWVNGGCQ